MGKFMISIKNIAEKCGVSIATVSKALNNHSDISTNTKNKIKEVAKELGYLPNSQAKALKTNVTYNIGIIFVDNSGNGLVHNYFSSVLNSLKKEVEKNGYDLMFISNNLVGNSPMSFYEHCKYRNVDGVVIACVDFYDSEIIKLLNSDIPAVTIDFFSMKNYSVVSDNKKGMEEIVQFVHEKGHRKIAYIYGDSSQVTTVRLNAFLETMNKLEIPVEEDYMKQGKYYDPILVEKIVLDMMSLYEPPTCIIAPDDFAAFCISKVLNEAGIKIPDDVSLVGYDGFFLSQASRPKLTTVRQDANLIGLSAAKLLLRLVKKESVPLSSRSMVIKGEFLEGETVKDLLNL